MNDHCNHDFEAGHDGFGVVFGISKCRKCGGVAMEKDFPTGQRQSKLLYEYFFADYVVRIIESEPGIVHFEQARIERGDPSIMRFERIDKPMGAANEILQLNEKVKKLNELWDEACADAVILDRELLRKLTALRAEREEIGS